MKPLIAIVGPTASGKTEVANLVARELGAHVFSIDAFQIYRGMDIGTAKARQEELLAPHELIDIADISEEYSAVKFQRTARAAIDRERAHGKWCVLAGGAGLYLDAVIDEMDFAKGHAGEARRKELEELSANELFSKLQSRDPKSAQMIDSHNKRRLIRALEMLDDNRTYVAENEKLHKRAPHYPAKIFALSWPRETLYARINERTKKMYAAGLVEETAWLKSRGLQETRNAKQAIGYAEALEVLAGNLSEAEAIERTAQRTRHYAKRQLSWLSRDGRAIEIDMEAHTPKQAAERIVCAARKAVSSHNY